MNSATIGLRSGECYNPLQIEVPTGTFSAGSRESPLRLIRGGSFGSGVAEARPESDAPRAAVSGPGPATAPSGRSGHARGIAASPLAVSHLRGVRSGSQQGYPEDPSGAGNLARQSTLH